MPARGRGSDKLDEAEMMLAGASYALDHAHRVLGELSVCHCIEDFSLLFATFVTSARSVHSWLAQLGDEPIELHDTPIMVGARLAFAEWFANASKWVARHPLHAGAQLVVCSLDEPLEAITVEIARSFDVQSSRHGRGCSRAHCNPGSFYVDVEPTKSALLLGRDYLDAMADLHDQATIEVRRLGLPDL